MSKLKKPITITIYTTENAVILFHQLRVWSDKDNFVRDVKLKEFKDVDGYTCFEVSTQLDKALQEQGIDPHTWKPEPVIKVGEHKITFNEDGSIKVGCTTVPKDTVAAIIAKIQETDKIFPRFFQANHNCVYCARSEADFGIFMYPGHVGESNCLPTALTYAKSENMVEINRQEAEKLIGPIKDSNTILHK